MSEEQYEEIKQIIDDIHNRAEKEILDNQDMEILKKKKKSLIMLILI